MNAAAPSIGTMLPRGERVQWPTLGAIVVLHIAVLLALAHKSDTPRPFALRPVTVSAFLYSDEPAPQPAPRRPTTIEPKPQPQLNPDPVIAIPEETPAPAVTEAVPVAPPPLQTPVPEAPPEPQPEATAAADDQAAPVPAPPPVAPPRFDADYLDNPAPAYPSLSRRLREEGTVRLRVYVERDGAPGQLEVQQSSGYPRLDAAALTTVKRWRFVPARRGEAAVAGWVIVPISFQLRSG